MVGPFGDRLRVEGRARQLAPRIDAGRDLAMALWGMAVTAVKDQSWPGVRVDSLTYRWQPELAERMSSLESDVYREMREWQL